VSDLRALSLAQLEQLLGAVESGDLKCPIKKNRLLAAGLDQFVDKLSALDGLEQVSVCAVLRAVLAERKQNQGPSLDLVWTGPDPEQGAARDTKVIVRELFARATREVIIGGCYFSSGREILQPLHTAMRDRKVKVTFCMNVGEEHRISRDPLANAQRFAVSFMQDNWFFGEPVPDFYFDPRTAKPGDLAKLHAKCIVIDERWSLLTSANFTYLGQHRNIEAGVLIDDAAFSSKLARQWRHLIHEKKLRACPLPPSYQVKARVLPEGWADAHQYLPKSWSELMGALIDAGVRGPDDYGAELTVAGLTSEHVSLMHWGKGAQRVSLVVAEQPIAGAEGDVVYLTQADEVSGVARRVAQSLGVKS
jgi:hypothetical protein